MTPPKLLANSGCACITKRLQYPVHGDRSMKRRVWLEMGVPPWASSCQR